MICRVLNEDDTVSDIHVEWHPEHVQRHGVLGDSVVPAGLWTTVDAVKSYYGRVNAYRREHGVPERDIDKAVAGISCAECPFEIYVQTEDGQPWKHNGTLARTVSYAGNDVFWKNHA